MVPWLCATIAAALLLVVTRVHGLGMSTDSVCHLTSAGSRRFVAKMLPPVVQALGGADTRGR